MRDLTIVLPHFQNLGMLAEQQTIWASYPKDVRRRLHIIVVDDCSPKGFRPSRKAVTFADLASFRIYRLLEKKRWNWLACRNLGARLATTEWLLLTDIDHAVPAETLQRVMDGPLEPMDAYRFKRKTVTRPWPYTLADCTDYKPHNDTWLLSKTLFFYDRGGKFVRGYDERLSGLYGTSGEFKDRVFACMSAHVMLPDVILRYPREVIADASTSPLVYTRKGDASNDATLLGRKVQRERIKNWRPLHDLIRHELIYASDAPKAVA